MNNMKSFRLPTALFLLTVLASTCLGQEIVDQWRYTLRRPEQGWRQSKFDDSNWTQGFGGFGVRDTPGSRVGTTWSTNNIWLRKSFELKSMPKKPALLIHHDEDTEVYINGKQVAALKQFTTEYIVVPLEDDKAKPLRVGKNLMAVHCKQVTGGQFIDVHVVDADNVPTLPKPKRSTKPFASKLTTRWGESVTPENAWNEYPRPLLRRENWTNLNGHWDYSITKIESKEIPSSWNGKILVPFCLESKLGGVQRLLDASEALWYRKSFNATKAGEKQLMVHFEAVDYRCEVFVNGKSVGTHVGGNTPFSFDISEAIKDGKNELIVRVEDATEEYQLRGKQVLNARGIWYTQVSGIWQTVWLEEVPQNHIHDLKISTSAENGTITVQPTLHGSGTLEVVVKDGDLVVAKGRGNNKIEVKVDKPKLWSPSSPHLYDLEIVLLDQDEARLDAVNSYAGIRTVGKIKDLNGHWKFTLNGKPIFHWGPLDQGWWPDGLLTPPSDEAMLFEIKWLKAAGFNMIRKHIKVEPRRYCYHCDRMGMMVWQDHVSGGVGKEAWPEWTRLKPNPVDAKWPAKHHEQFMLELDRMITTLESYPSIVSWVPFNERWGQHKTMEVGEWTVKRDPSRLINIASGGNFWPIGDVVDAHNYPHPDFPFGDGKGHRFDDYIKVVGEFGGHGFPVQGHLWDANRRNWGYGGLPQNAAEYKQRYQTSIKMLNELRQKGIAAGVYTQTTDVEGEINGLMTYDRKVIKIPANELALLHKVLFAETPENAAAKDQPKEDALHEVSSDRQP